MAPETHPKPSWRARKEQYIDSIAEKTASEVLVSVADKLHNARAILRDFHALGDALWRRFNPEAGKTGTLGYYRGLVMAFERRIDQLQDPRLEPLISDLSHVVTMLEREVGVAGTWPLPNVATSESV